MDRNTCAEHYIDRLLIAAAEADDGRTDLVPIIHAVSIACEPERRAFAVSAADTQEGRAAFYQRLLSQEPQRIARYAMIARRDQRPSTVPNSGARAGSVRPGRHQ